ncbi:FkbM family methyltransferase [Falsiroseomonas selenitidurans]|uniref:FkbM family methyltransferase n=1 Tax=Falsiroseomonas selenitidurans TaxID=2716335 RepID=A0ABX1E3K4_9PROT|nr:FkbM family methyltransferase [Falsiroseomonas selenitidurans]NKC31760.1 FkbM family methyltransferase [Falsiroseomonas selenitidurans]
MLRDLLSLPGRLLRMQRRLEESIAYFATRTHPSYFVQNAYLGDNTALARLQGRLKIFVDTRGNDIAPHLLMDGAWEPDDTSLFQRLIQPGDTVLDLGAHLGVYSLLGALATGPTGRVEAFEPNPRFAALLARSLAVNGFADFARVNNMAVGAEEGVAELLFSYAWGGGGHISVNPGHVPEGDEIRACRVVAVDDMFPDPAFQVNVMKIDVEGTESRAVRGMWNLLARSPRARVMFEFAPGMLAAQGSSAAELVHLFAELGFRFWAIGPQAVLEPVEAAVLSDMTAGVRNILAAREHPFPA